MSCSAFNLSGVSASSDSKCHKNAEHDRTLETYGKLSLFIFLTSYQHWDQKVQNSVFYEAFLPITWIKPSAGVTKYRKCMGSHIVRDIMMPWTVWMVGLCINTEAPDSQKPTWSQIIRVVWEFIIKNTLYKQPGELLRLIFAGCVLLASQYSLFCAQI